MQQSKTRKMIFMGMFIAMEIVLSRFLSIELTATYGRIGFGFLPIALSGAMFGPLGGGAVAFLADLLRANIFPTGAFNPLFTLLAGLRGVIYGLVLQKNPTGKVRIVIASAINFLGVNVLLKSLVMAYSYSSKSYLVWMAAQFPENAVNFVVQTGTLLLIAEMMKVRNVRMGESYDRK